MSQAAAPEVLVEGDGAIAVAVYLLLATGPDTVPSAAAFPAALLMGSLFRRVESVVRARRAKLTHAAESDLAAGEDVAWERLIVRGMAPHLAATALFLYVAVAALGPVLDLAWLAAPDFARRGFELSFENAPWLGLAALLYSLRPKG